MTKFNEIASKKVKIHSHENIASDLIHQLLEIDMDTLYRFTGDYTSENHLYPDEVICEMVENVLAAYIKTINLYIQNHLLSDANNYCKGVMIGLHDFKFKVGSKIFTELPDGLINIISTDIIELFDQLNENELSEDIDNFLKTKLPEWKHLYIK